MSVRVFARVSMLVFALLERTRLAGRTGGTRRVVERVSSRGFTLLQRGTEGGAAEVRSGTRRRLCGRISSILFALLWRRTEGERLGS